MARPDFDDSPDTGGGNEGSGESNVGVHYNSPPTGEIQFRAR